MSGFWTASLAAGLALGLAGPAGAAVTLSVTSLPGGQDIDFGNARSLGPEGQLESDTVVRQVRVTITSTSGKPYQLFQEVHQPWTNLTGEELPLDNVQFFISDSSTSATVRFPNPAPLVLGQQEIFLSDGKGSSDELVITYTARVPPGQQMGDYRANLSFQVVSQ